jgi:hypothetical protein
MAAITSWPYKVPEPKDPQATLDYSIDWSDWLSDGELIVNSAWATSSGEITAPDFNDTAASVWLSGGEVGIAIILTNTITTNSAPVARVDERSLVIKVKQR